MLFAVAAAALVVAGQPAPQASLVGATIGEHAGMPRPLYWLANIVCYGLGEELGWRG